MRLKPVRKFRKQTIRKTETQRRMTMELGKNTLISLHVCVCVHFHGVCWIYEHWWRVVVPLHGEKKTIIKTVSISIFCVVGAYTYWSVWTYTPYICRGLFDIGQTNRKTEREFLRWMTSSNKQSISCLARATFRYLLTNSQSFLFIFLLIANRLYSSAQKHLIHRYNCVFVSSTSIISYVIFPFVCHSIHIIFIVLPFQSYSMAILRLWSK